MIKRKVCLFACFIFLFIPLILLSQIKFPQYYNEAERLDVDSNKYVGLKISSVSKVCELFNKSLDKNTNSIETQQLMDSLLSKIDNPVGSIDSCNTIIEIGKLLQEKTQYADALKLLFYLHTYFQEKTIKKNEDYLVFSKIKLDIGRIYREIGMWVAALNYLNEALSISKSQNDQEGIADAYHSIGTQYLILNNFVKAKQNINNSININLQLGLKKGLFSNYNNLANIYVEQENYIAALDYYHNALKQLDSEADYAAAISLIYLNLGNVHSRIGEMETALFYINLADEQKYNPSLVWIYITKVEIYQLLGMHDSCTKYLNKALLLAKDIGSPNISLSTLKIAREYFYKIEDLKSAYKYSLEFNRINDSIDLVNSNLSYDLINNTSTIYKIELENSLLKQELDYEEKAIRQKNIWGFVIFAILLAGIILFILLLRSRKREFKILSESSEIQEKFLQQEKQIQLQNENELTKEIEYKNRQLTTTTLQLSRYNQFILKTIKELQEILLAFKSHESTKRKKIQELINELRHFISGNNWDEFRLYFEEVHPSFYENLSKAFPKLTKNELKLSALIKLGLSNKDIASIIFKEIRSIESARNRLRKKIGLNTNDSLYDFLSNY